jgi:hypothetical protein
LGHGPVAHEDMVDFAFEEGFHYFSEFGFDQVGLLEVELFNVQLRYGELLLVTEG